MHRDTRPTLATVAARAQVSKQTVSNVLNNPEVVLPETRDRVLAAVAELGYRPNVAARQLRTRRSSVLGLRIPPVTDGISGQILDRFLHALTAHAQQHGMRIMIFAADDAAAEVREYEDLLATAVIDGVVLTDTHSGDLRTRWLSEHHVPYVTFGRPWDDAGDDAGDGAAGDAADGHAWVDIDGRAGTAAATAHLLAQGHRAIGFVGWPVGSDVGDDRYLGYLDALTAQGLMVDPALVRRCEDSVAQGRAAAEDLLAATDVTAVVCVSDTVAVGALAARTAHEAAHPGAEPLAVTGFDDTPVAAALGLTSVAQRVEAAGVSVLELLRHQLAATSTAVTRNPDLTPVGPVDRQVLIEPQLVVRTSSQAPALARAQQ